MHNSSQNKREYAASVGIDCSITIEADSIEEAREKFLQLVRDNSPLLQQGTVERELCMLENDSGEMIDPDYHEGA